MPTELLQEDLLNFFFLLKIQGQISEQIQRFFYFFIAFSETGTGKTVCFVDLFL